MKIICFTYRTDLCISMVDGYSSDSYREHALAKSRRWLSKRPGASCESYSTKIN